MTPLDPLDVVFNRYGYPERIYLRVLNPRTIDTKNPNAEYELISVVASGIKRKKVYQSDLRDFFKGRDNEISTQIGQLLENIETNLQVSSNSAFVPKIMGILNVTPDSFYDGGRYLNVEMATAAALRMVEAGADIIDVGGESTRPGSVEPTEAEELKRVIPVIRALSEKGITVSIDTRRATVMERALESGAKIINDISALSHDKRSIEVATSSGARVILMHMQGSPKSMQTNPYYEYPSLDIFDFLKQRIVACLEAGIHQNCLLVDPGIGFGKTKTHNIQVLRDIALFHGLGCPVLIGMSRKSFISDLLGNLEASDRMPGSIAGALYAMSQGVHIVRVHDVAETNQSLKVWQAIF